MKKTEYEQKKKEMQARHTDELSALMVEYAKANNPVSIGDIVRSNTETILVDSIKYGSHFGEPQGVYRGVMLTKQLKPFKNGDRGTVWQQYMIEHIKSQS